MQTVTSADGTTIAYDRTGEGPALVLVVGAFCDRFSTVGLAEGLAAHATVYAYDRRGRGMSGDRQPYAVQREVEDLAAVIDAAGGSAMVYGHSSGGILGLEAAARGVPVTRLAVYEPPYTAGDDQPGGSTDLLEAVRAAVAAGERQRAAVTFLQGAGTPPQVLSHIQNGPGWSAMQELAPTLVYDLELANGGVAPAERLARISVPTLLLSGGDSPPWARQAAERVAGSVPDVREQTVPGQTHAVAPDALVPVLTEFFTG